MKHFIWRYNSDYFAQAIIFSLIYKQYTDQLYNADLSFQTLLLMINVLLFNVTSMKKDIF